jgi:hypothetical protein
MYKVYKTTWIHSKPVLQYVAEFTDQELAKQKAKKLKGLVKLNDQICYDFRS